MVSCRHEMLAPPKQQRTMNTVDLHRVDLFKGLLEAMLVLDPMKRATPDHALSHSFFTNYPK